MAQIQTAFRRAYFLLRGGDRLTGWDDEDATRGFHLLLAFFLVWMGALSFLVFPWFVVRKVAGAGFLVGAGGSALAALVLLRRGRKNAAAVLFLSVVWSVAAGYSLFSGGLRSVGVSLNVVLILGAGWLLGRSAALIFAAATLLLASSEAVLAYAGYSLPTYFPSPPLVLLSVLVGIVVLAVGPILSVLEAQRRQVSALRESEERFRGLSNAAFEGIAIHERGAILDTNRAFARLFGYERPGELVGKDGPELLLTPESRARVHRRMERHETGVIEVTGVRKDGGTFTAEVESQPVKYRGHDASLAACRDVTERKHAAEARRESEERYRALFDRSLDCVFLTDFEGHFLDANQAALDLLGYRREDIATVTFQSLLTEDQLPSARRTVEQILATGRQQNPTEYRLRAKDGRYVSVETQSSLIYREGEAFAIQGIARDISERKRAEEERARLQAQLHQAQKMESIGRLAGGVAHDFNNLLTVINGYSQLMLAKLSAGDPLRAGLAEIHSAGERAAGLTRQLLAFSRKQVLRPRVLDVNRVVEAMQPMLERLVGEDVEVRVALDAGSGTVQADPHQLEQAIMNLAVNARDAMPHGGKLRISTATVDCGARAGRYVMLAVSDSGVGMDEATRQRIFEPFFTTKEAGKGTGLGLSVVQGSVEQSGGHIEVHSEPGRGTTFEIYLPALAVGVADPGRAPAVPAPGGQETILVVEDQPEVLRFTAAALRSYGYQVIQTAGAGEALLLCEREGDRIDLVLTDVVMPNVSGLELADGLAKLRPGMKVLFMSGYADSLIAHDGVLDGGLHFIEKPFSPEELARKVRALLWPPAPAARILVADDEPGVRGFLRAALEQGGYQVTEAANGKQALQEALAGHTDLVITDIVMPEQEGIETIRALRRDVPGVGIIAISGAFGGQFLKAAHLLGADAVLSKPVNAEVLLAKVAEVLKPRP